LNHPTGVAIGPARIEQSVCEIVREFIKRDHIALARAAFGKNRRLAQSVRRIAMLNAAFVMDDGKHRSGEIHFFIGLERSDHRSETLRSSACRSGRKPRSAVGLRKLGRYEFSIFTPIRLWRHRAHDDGFAFIKDGRTPC
jgi:hypothetical protein